MRASRGFTGIVTVAFVLAVGGAGCGQGTAALTTPPRLVPAVSAGPTSSAAPTASPATSPTTQSSPNAQPSPTIEPSPSPDPDAPVAPKVIATVEAGLQNSCWTDGNSLMGQGAGLLWIACGDVIGFDPNTGVVKQRIHPTHPNIAFAGNAFFSSAVAEWVEVHRFDLASGKITRKYDNDLLAGVGNGFVWLESGWNDAIRGPARILKVDPTTGRILSTITWRAGRFDGVGCGLLWADRPHDGEGFVELVAVNAGNGAVVKRWTVKGANDVLGPVMETGDGCWLRLDTVDSRLVELTAKGAGRVSNNVDGLAIQVINGKLWACDGGGYMARFDPTASPMMGRKYLISAQGPSPLDVACPVLFGAGGTYWTVDPTTGALQQLDIPNV